MGRNVTFYAGVLAADVIFEECPVLTAKILNGLQQAVVVSYGARDCCQRAAEAVYLM